MTKRTIGDLTDSRHPGSAGGSLFVGEGTALTPSTFSSPPGRGASDLFAGEGTALTPSTFLAPEASRESAAEAIGARASGAKGKSRAGHTARGTA